MSIVSLESADEKNVSASIVNFLTAHGIISLLSKCGGLKLKGIPVKELFTYTLTNAFRMGSFYMQHKLGKVREGFSKNTYYRFLMNPRTNWLRFTTMLSERIINGHIRPLTSENRDDCFVIDDSLYERAGFKRTELASWVFDHVSMRCKKGFRLLTLGWTDGCTFLPINYSLLASNDDEKILGPCNKVDKRTIAGKRRLMARQKATSVMIDLLKTALAAGHRAKYVLFDSWFSNPQQLLDIRKLGLNTIAMVKRSNKRFYLFEGKPMDIKQIFASSKKRRGRSRYLLSVSVKVGQDNNGENGIDARIVCVRNRNNRKDWIAIICTDMSLSENDIIRIYGHR
ncbi:MAG: transposase, partial [Selenomonadaceae bacterium]|nr:transposase [Selenomonadaceae bacterium]